MILLRSLLENVIQTMYGNHCRILYNTYQDGYMIQSIRTETKFLGNGYAFELLSKFVKKCDSENKAIYLLVSPLNKKTNINRLIKLYQKVGFKLTGHIGNPAGDPYMKREPVNLITEDYIGTVYNGVCKGVPVNDAYKEVHATHGMLSGYNEFNWRYIKRRNVVLWNLQPSLEDQDRVDNFLSKRGVVGPVHKNMYNYK